MLPLAEYGLTEALVTTLAIFFFVIWIWILIVILTDLFNDHELSGWGKAAWVLFLILIPMLTGLIYLIARGSGMRARSLKAQSEAREHFNEYVRDAAQTSPVDELHKLAELKEKGAITDAEYETMKKKYVS